MVAVEGESCWGNYGLGILTKWSNTRTRTDGDTAEPEQLHNQQLIHGRIQSIVSLYCQIVNFFG